jgi:hypothetical protein
VVTVANVLTETTLQHHVEEAALSRISSFELFGSLAAQPIGQTGTGPIAASIGVFPALWIAGTAQLISALAALTIPAIRHLPARSETHNTPSPSSGNSPDDEDLLLPHPDGGQG